MTDDHDEHYESIPWDSLVTDDARRRRRLLYLGVGLVLALAVGAAVGRSLDTRGTAPPAPEVVGSTTTSITTEPTTTSPVAGPMPADELAVMAHAAWFVADYFTIDGSDLTRQSVLDRLPPGVELPVPDGSARSFVESVFPTSVERLGSNRFRVVSVVRTLAAADGSAYRRQPARAVETLVDVTADGPVIIDLPRPLPLDVGAAPALSVDAQGAPDVVMAAADEEARRWGTPVGDAVSGNVGGLWRVVQFVEDGEGLIWPVASWFDDTGGRAVPSS